MAQIDIQQSIFGVAILAHRRTHRYLFTNLLTNFESPANGTDFYLSESSTLILHSILKRTTPQEIITGS